MGAHQDDKLAKMRAALVVTNGTINDLEGKYIAGLWASSSLPVTNEEWMAYWDLLSVPPASFNDRASVWLENESHEGDLTGQWASYWASQLLPSLPDEGGIMGSGQRLFEFAAGAGPAVNWTLNGTNAVINAVSPGGNCVLAQGAIAPNLTSNGNFGLWPVGQVYTALWNVQAAMGAAALYRITIPNGGGTSFLPPTTGPFFAVSNVDETAAATGRAELSNVAGNSLTLNFFDWFLGDHSVEFLGRGYTQVPWT